MRGNQVVLLNTPGNPSGAVASQRQCAELLELCRAKGVLLISDEIYDEFTYPDARVVSEVGDRTPRCPSPARVAGSHADGLLARAWLRQEPTGMTYKGDWATRPARADSSRR